MSCSYCWKNYENDVIVGDLRRVQLSHNPQDPNSWQPPMDCCYMCRLYLNGQFRYVR